MRGVMLIVMMLIGLTPLSYSQVQSDEQGKTAIRDKMMEAQQNIKKEQYTERITSLNQSQSIGSGRSSIMRLLDVIAIVGMLSAFVIAIYRIKEKPQNMYETIVGFLIAIAAGSVYLYLFV